MIPPCLVRQIACPADLSPLLQRRASLLEDMVCTFSAQQGHASNGDQPGYGDIGDHGPGHIPMPVPNATTDPKVHLLQALNSALEIFFYRRIRNIHPRILQGHVNNIVRSLKLFDAASSDSHLLGAGTFWLVFVAGCEAMATPSRQFFEDWITRGYHNTGIHGFRLAKDIMNQVWQRRDEMAARSRRNETSTASPKGLRSVSTQCSWIDISRELNVWVLLC